MQPASSCAAAGGAAQIARQRHDQNPRGVAHHGQHGHVRSGAHARGAKEQVQAVRRISRVPRPAKVVGPRSGCTTAPALTGRRAIAGPRRPGTDDPAAAIRARPRPSCGERLPDVRAHDRIAGSPIDRAAAARLSASAARAPGAVVRISGCAIAARGRSMSAACLSRIAPNTSGSPSGHSDLTYASSAAAPAGLCAPSTQHLASGSHR